MKNFYLNKKLISNNQDGFIETIILIVIALLLMRYFDITLTSIYYWLKDLVYSVL